MTNIINDPRIAENFAITNAEGNKCLLISRHILFGMTPRYDQRTHIKLDFDAEDGTFYVKIYLHSSIGDEVLFVSYYGINNPDQLIDVLNYTGVEWENKKSED